MYLLTHGLIIKCHSDYEVRNLMVMSSLDRISWFTWPTFPAGDVAFKLCNLYLIGQATHINLQFPVHHHPPLVHYWWCLVRGDRAMASSGWER